MELRKWPRKNDPESIKARQAALDGRIDAEVFQHDLAPWVSAQEALTGVSLTPTAVIGPLTISIGDYELTEPDGELVERGRKTDEVFVPLAHTLIFAPGRGWIDGLPQFGLGAMGGWLALMSYVVLLGLAMLWRWRHGAWRRFQLGAA